VDPVAWRLEPKGAGLTAIAVASGGTVTFGRDPSCDIVFDASYGGISRKHATISADGAGLRIADLDSSNGTFVNGERVSGTVPLRGGDSIAFSDEATFAVVAVATPAKVVRPGGALNPNPRLLSELLPFLSRGDRGRSLRRYIVPAFLIGLGVVLLFVTSASDQQTTFLYVLAAFLGIGALAIIDAFANHPRPWWVLGLAAAMTAGVLLWPNSPIVALDFYVFRQLLPGAVDPAATASFHTFVTYFFGAGCAEELLKALPVLVAFVALRKRGFGPLDGLVIGAASGLGFTWVETLLQYMPDAVARAQAQTQDPAMVAVVALELEIPRIIGAISGHMAWAGYVGYAIGAAARASKVSRRIALVLGAYLVAATLHAAWDTIDLTGPVASAMSTAIGLLSFLLLASAAARGRLAAAAARGQSK